MCETLVVKLLSLISQDILPTPLLFQLFWSCASALDLIFRVIVAPRAVSSCSLELNHLIRTKDKRP